MELINIITLLLLVLVIGCAIKYFRNLTEVEYIGKDRVSQNGNTSRLLGNDGLIPGEEILKELTPTQKILLQIKSITQQPSSVFGYSIHDTSVKLKTLTVSTVGAITDIVAKTLPISITTVMADRLNELNQTNTQNDKIASLNNNFLANQTSNILSDDTTKSSYDLPWDSDPTLEDEVCDFNIEDRPNKLEEIVVY
jgi:hypothetical protein